MTAMHLEFLVEEPSMEAFLRALLPRLLPSDRSFEVHPFQGKSDLLSKLLDRLRGYAQWLPEDWRIVVVVDRDDDDCAKLKTKLEAMAEAAGLMTRSRAAGRRWQLVNRIAIEELEAWYFGDWQAVCRAIRECRPTFRSRQPFAIPMASAVAHGKPSSASYSGRVISGLACERSRPREPSGLSSMPIAAIRGVS